MARELSNIGVEDILKLIAESFDVDGQADVVTSRNNLKRIGKTPDVMEDAWEMDCVLLGNTVFLETRVLTEGTLRNIIPATAGVLPSQLQISLSGISEEAVNASPTFFSISQLQLGSHMIVLSSKIDCFVNQQDDSGNPLNGYVELKSMRKIDSYQKMHNASISLSHVVASMLPGRNFCHFCRDSFKRRTVRRSKTTKH